MKGRRPEREGPRGGGGGGESEERLVCGTHPVEEILRSNPGSIRALFLAPAPHRGPLEAILKAARDKGISVSFEPMQALDNRSQGVRHQGVIAACAPYGYADLDAVLLKLKDKEHALVVLLDSVQDPHNMGAIIRSACGFFADLVVVPKDRASPVTAQVERAAAGTTAQIPIARVTNLKRAMEQLKDAGFWIVGAGTRDGVALKDFKFANKTGLVIGAEGEGMRAGVEAAVDHVVTIPISPRAESLNASNAAAIILYEISRQR
jgi:23S rRNA (guanosine2251-2'-O)-methyltransferase